MVTNNALNKSSPDFTVDNLFLDGNTVSTTDIDGNLILSPDGAGEVRSTAVITQQNFESIGNTIRYRVQNTDNTSTDSNAGLVLRTGGDSGGDPYIRMGISGNGEVIFGQDNSDSDKIIIGYGGSDPSDTTTYWQMTTAGERTMPLQPAFLAYLATDDNNLTGDGTNFNLGNTDVGTALTEVIDQGGDFTPGASGGAVFTSPVTGRYILQAEVNLRQISSAGATQINLDMTTSNRRYGNFNGVADITTADTIPLSVTTMADLDVGDTVTYLTAASGGTKTVDIDGNADCRTWVSGSLVC